MVCSSMDGSLSLTGQAEPSGVTQFANEACVGVETIANPYSPIDLRVNTDLQDIKVYFQRPRLVVRGSIAAGRNVVASQNVDTSFLTSVFPQWANRLSGAYGIRFTTCFRLQVAATPFHQFLLAMAFQYGWVNNNGNFPRGLTQASSTNLPHVRLDPTEHTMVELKVPFLYQTDFRPVNASDISGGVVGQLSINSILPYVAVAGLSVATFELYCWLEDIELFGADNNSTTLITLQSGVITSELRKSKLVSSTLSQGSKIASFVSKHVPMLSAIAGPTAWALDIASGVAKYFGFSTPMVQEPSLRVANAYAVGEGQVDLPFAGFALGPLQSNTLAVDHTIGSTDVDEMALAFLFSQYSQVCVGQVTTANAHGTVVYAAPVSPSSFWFRAPASAPYCNKVYPLSSASLLSQSGNSFLPSTLMNISSFFRLWRGTIKFRFTFSKTKFHGGRYMVSFNPSTNTSSTVAAVLNTIDGPETVSGLVQPYGYSMIMDLRDSNVFEFTVPHMIEMSYLNFLSNYGGISIVCIDPLQATGTVTTTVPFLVEVCGGDDFEVADYAGNFFVPAPNGTIYSQSSEVTSKLDPVLSSSSGTPCERTIGERITSVKQLIQIPSYSRANIGANTISVSTLPPWYYYSGYTILSGGNTSPVAAGLSYLGASYAPGALAKMYAFARGGSDYHAVNLGPATTVSFSFEQNPLECSVGIVDLKTLNGRSNTGSTPKIVATTDRPLHVRSPAYQAVPRVLTHSYDVYNVPRIPGVTVASATQFQTGHWPRLITYNTSGTLGLQALLACNAADDAMLGAFIGPQPVIIPSSLAANNVHPDWMPGTTG